MRIKFYRAIVLSQMKFIMYAIEVHHITLHLIYHLQIPPFITQYYIILKSLEGYVCPYLPFNYDSSLDEKRYALFYIIEFSFI